jgi:HlyD family secretion protein
MKKRKWWILVILVILLGAGYAAVRIFGSGGNTAVIAGTAEVLKGKLEATVSANGTLVAKDLRDVYVESPVKVLDILVDKDKPVKKGEPVLSVDMADLTYQLEQARLNRDSQELTLRRVRDINVSQSLQTLQLSVKQAEAVLASDRENLARAKADYDTNKKLHDSGTISDSEFQRIDRIWQDAQNRISISEISLSSAKANLASSQSTSTRTDDQRALDIATQENMLKMQELTLKNLEDRIARVEASVKSPIDGVVTVMNAVKGVTLNAAQPAYRVSDVGTLEVDAEVKEVEARRIHVGQKVEITGDGIDEAVKVEGLVTGISSTAYIVRNTTGEETVVGITVTVDNPPEGLKPGLTVTNRIITDTRTDVPVIRYAMLAETPEGKAAVFLVKDGYAVLVPIELGITSDLNIEVTKGLAGGETAVLNPPQTLKDGMKVVIVAAKTSVFPGGMR